jgi:hypothetical protein
MGQSHDTEVGFKEKNLTFYVKSYVLHRRSSDVLQQGGHFLENMSRYSQAYADSL